MQRTRQLMMIDDVMVLVRPPAALWFHECLREWMAVPRLPTFYIEGPADVLERQATSRGPTAVKTQRPIITDDEHVVLKFRPRTSAHPPTRRDEPTPPNARPAANDLSHYERPRDEPDDFRQRMLANVAALAFTVALTAIGIWLAVSIADLRRTQDCVLMGRRDCARISVTP